MQLVQHTRKVLMSAEILTLSFQHGDGSHAIIITNGDLVSTPKANKVTVKIDTDATRPTVEMDDKGHYLCIFPSQENYNNLVKF